MTTSTAVIMPSSPNTILPDANAHPVKPSDNVVSIVTKIRWKAFSDMAQWVMVFFGKSFIAQIVSPNNPMTKETVKERMV